MRTVFALLLALGFSSSTVAGQTFPFPPSLNEEVRFWEAVFGTYTSSHVILHDSQFMDVVYEVIDFSRLDDRKDLSAEEKKEIRVRNIRTSRSRIVRSLHRLASDPPQDTLTLREREIQALFENIPGPSRYRDAAKQVRIQTGQRDHLIRAIRKSKDWMGDIEAVFERQGLPRGLTALVFVESMFNPRAVSEVGASGLWQFMPDTGQDYLSINRFWDGRNDPIQSSLGAARFLKDLHRMTGDWALAINAYHSGPTRILEAMRKLKTKDISEIIHRFRDPGYQFYSRNYYPQFLAVLEIYGRKKDYLGPIEEGPDLRYDIVQTKYFVNLPEVAQQFAIDLNHLRLLNTSLSREVLSGDLPLPPNFLLKVPKGYGYYLARAIGYSSQAVDKGPSATLPAPSQSSRTLKYAPVAHSRAPCIRDLSQQPGEIGLSTDCSEEDRGP